MREIAAQHALLSPFAFSPVRCLLPHPSFPTRFCGTLANWNSLCSPCLPQILAVLCLVFLTAEFTGIHHHTGILFLIFGRRTQGTMTCPRPPVHQLQLGAARHLEGLLGYEVPGREECFRLMPKRGSSAPQFKALDRTDSMATLWEASVSQQEHKRFQG